MLGFTNTVTLVIASAFVSDPCACFARARLISAASVAWVRFADSWWLKADGAAAWDGALLRRWNDGPLGVGWNKFLFAAT